MSAQENLLLACSRGEYKYLKEFIRKNPKKQRYEIKDNHGWGPLHHAVASNSLGCVEMLLASKLIDTRRKTHEGYTCLFVAIVKNVDCSIIELLLRHDPELFNQPNNENEYPIHKAILAKSLKMVQTMIDTLKQINFPIKDQIDWDEENCLILAVRQKHLQIIDYLIANMEINFQHVNDAGLNALSVALIRSGDNTDLFTIEIIEKLMPLTYNDEADNFMQQLMIPLSLSCMFENNSAFNWFMQQYYLNDTNEHSDLVEHVLKHLEDKDFDCREIILSLHSKITYFLVKENDSRKNDIIYQHLITNLHHIYKEDIDLFAKIVNILSPKLDLDNFNYAVMKFLPTTSIEGTEMVNNFMEMFEIMKVENLIDIKKLFFFTPSITYFNNVFLLLMPFSVEPTADSFVQDTSFSEPFRLKYDVGLARFCVDGYFRTNNSLKSLCRSVIRLRILKFSRNGNSNSEKLQRIRSLNLPNKIINFLLFNYTDYSFK